MTGTQQWEEGLEQLQNSDLPSPRDSSIRSSWLCRFYGSGCSRALWLADRFSVFRVWEGQRFNPSSVQPTWSVTSQILNPKRLWSCFTRWMSVWSSLCHRCVNGWECDELLLQLQLQLQLQILLQLQELQQFQQLEQQRKLGAGCNLCTKEGCRGSAGVECGSADKQHMHYLKTKVKNAH